MRQFLLLLFLGLATQCAAQDERARRNHYNLNDAVAIQGYDPVSYFSGKPQMGNVQFSTTYKGVIYWFVSETNKNIFWQKPDSYEPQYGGWCAYAMGDYGKKVAINPETYKIVEGKLFLFYNAYLNNTLNDWNKNEISLKMNADKTWNQIINK